MLRASVSLGSVNSKSCITFASRSMRSSSSDSALPTSRAALLPRYVMTLAVIAAPALAVLLVDVLNDTLAPIAARQIEIDVGPLAALLGQEALEQQLHLDRIDRRDPEAVADGAVGRRPAALHEDVLLPAVVDDVPDDQEVAGEIELLDEIELAGDLRARLLVIRAIAIARADFRHVAQERRRGLARRHGIDREAISQIRHRVLEPLGQRLRACERFGKIGEELRHHLGRLEISLGVSRQPSAGGIERGVMPHAGEHVEERAIGRRRAAHVVGGDDRHAKPAGELDQRRVLTFLVAQEMALQLDAHVAATEETDQAIEQPTHAVMPRIEQRPTRERDEPSGEALELLERERALSLGGAQLHARHEATEIFVALWLRRREREGARLPGLGIRDPGSGSSGSAFLSSKFVL